MRSALRGGLIALFLGVLAGGARAVEPVFEFLDGLRGDRQGSMAIAYLNMLKETKRVPPELEEVFDLEMARSLQVAADETVNEDEAAKFRKDAQAALETFLKTGSAHPEAGFAFDTYGNLSMDRGNKLSRQTAQQKDPARKEALAAEARKEFADAKPRFEEAVKRFAKRLEDAEAEVKAAVDQSQNKKGNIKFKRAAQSADQQRAFAENDWLNARFKLAMLEYYIAQTYSDPKKPEVQKSLNAAITALDLIYQGYRENRPGVLAHFWHGMALKELAGITGKAGDKTTAEDIFDEVVARTPAPSAQNDPSYVAFYAEAERQKLLLLAEKQKYDQIIEEGEGFLEYQKVRTDPYYGIALEVAKAYLAKATKMAQGAERKKVVTTAVGKLRDATKQQSVYHRESTALLNKYAAEIGQESTADTFDAAISVADIAFQSGDPKGAVEGYLKALELAKKEKANDKTKERVELVRLTLASARYAAQDYAGAYADAIGLAKEDPNAKIAPKAAVMAIHSALAQFGSAQDKAAVQQQLMDAANYTMTTWPKRAEADDARIALGKLKAVQGDVVGAMQTFEAVNPASDRYPQALQLAAQSHWKFYVDGKRTGKIDDAAKKHRETAIKQLEQALAKLNESPPPPEMAATATETPLLLAEIRIDDGGLEDALKLLVPLIDKIQGQTSEGLDITGMRILVSAIRIYATLKKTTEATQLGFILLEKGQDIPPVNAVLASVSQILRADYIAKQAEAAAAGPDNMGAAAALTQSKQAVTDFLTKLGDRKALGLTEMMVLGDTAKAVGSADAAKNFYGQALTMAEGNPNPQMKSAINGVKSRMIGLLRDEKKFDEAMTQVDSLIKDVPRALEPKVERARILTGMAESAESPTMQQWTTATEAWAQLRNMMQGMPKKPAEYYEAIYETARGLSKRAELTTNKKESDEFKSQGRQLLKGATALSPKLSGPDMVAKYEALLGELGQQ